MRTVLVVLVAAGLVLAAFREERSAREALRARIESDASAYARLRGDFDGVERALLARPLPSALEAARGDAYAARVAAAALALDADDLAEAREHLARAPEGERGFEWDLLRGGVARRVDERLRTDVPILRVAVGSDGRVAVARDDGGLTVSLTDALGDVDDTEADPAAPERLGLAFVGTRYLAVALDQGGVDVHDAVTLEPLRRLAVHEGPVWQVAGSTRDDLLVTAAHDGTAKVVDVESGEVLATFSGHVGELFCVALTPDGTRAATAGEDGSLRLWSTADGTELAALEHLEGWVVGLDVSDDAALVCARTDLGEVVLWRPGTKPDEGGFTRIGGRDDPIASSLPSSDGTTVALGRDDGTIVEIDARSGAPQRTLRTGGGAIERLFAADDDLLFLSTESALFRWRRGGGADRSFPSGSDWVNVLALSGDGRTLATGSADGTVRVHEARTGALLHELKAHTRGVTAVAVDADGKALTAGGGDGVVTRHDLRSGARTGRFGEEIAIVAAVGRAGASGALPIVYGNGAMRVLDVATGSTRRETPPMTFWIHAFSRDLGATGTLAWAAAGGNFRAFDVESGEKRGGFRFDGTVPVAAVAWHEGTRRAALALASGDVEIWSADADERIALLENDRSPIEAIVFHPDGRRVVTGDLSGRIGVWDADRGLLLLARRGTKQGVTSLAFSPDGRRLFAAGHAGIVDVFDGSPP